MAQYDISVIEDEDGHGTGVAGVVASQMNGAGIVGIAPQTELLIIKCEVDEAGKFVSSADIVFALYYAIEMDADVVNMSFSGVGGSAMKKALELAVDSDIICVAAAGNEAMDEPSYPAAYESVIGVGALADGGWQYASYSNYGPNADIMAPGTVLTTACGGGYTYLQGTSMSAPMVTAAAALYVSQNRYATYDSAKADLLAAGRDLGDPGEDWIYGFGALDIHAFVCEKKGRITYDYCTEELETTTQAFVRRHTIQTVPEPERENIVFDDWYYDKAYTKVFDYDAWYTTEFVEDVTLYAKWVNEEDEGASVYNYETQADGTVEIVSYKGKRRYLTIPNEIDGKTVSSIGEGAFAGNSRLREVTFPEGLVSIGEKAFSEVKKLREISFAGTKMTQIRDEAFKDCISLRKLNLPDSLKTIGDEAFSGCGSLREVRISENSSLTAMGKEAFAYTPISTFYFPRNVGSGGFDGSVLAYCANMRIISVHTGNTAFMVEDNTLYNAGKTRIVYYPAGCTDAYRVADSVDAVGPYAFAGSSLTAVDLNTLTTIGEYAFASAQKLSAVLIPDTVTEMGKYAFRASSVRQVTLSNNLMQIPEGAFLNTELEAVHIPAKVQAIGCAAFQSCSYLKQVSFAESSQLESILGDEKKGAFAQCRNLKSITLPESLVSIGQEAFLSCKSLTELYIPANVCTLDQMAFQYCAGLTQVSFAENCALTKIAEGCFANCSLLSTVKFSDRIQTLGDHAFAYDEKLVNLIFGGGSVLTQVGNYGFYNCARMQNMQLPESVQTIGEFAFAFSGLQKAEISAKISRIGNGAFGACYSLRQITAAAENPNYTAVDNVLFSKDLSTVYCVPASFEGAYSLPSTVKVLAPCSFYYDIYLNAVTLPAGLEDIQMNSFFNCRNLQSIRIPASVTNIGRKAFENCHALKEVTFDGNSALERLGLYTFVNCGMTEITIPASVKEIAQYTFYNCSDLQKITFAKNSRVTNIAAHLLSGTNVREVIFEEGSALSSLQSHAFDGALQLQTVDFGDARLTNVDNYAFYGCSRLENIQIPDSVTYIGRYAFYDCGLLEQINLSEEIDYIGESAFAGTGKLKIFFAGDNLPANVQPGWDQGIAGYTLGTVDYVSAQLWNYTIQKDGTITLISYKGTETALNIDTVDGHPVARIGTRCFCNNDTLTSITLNDRITEIGNYAFYGCDALGIVEVPANVKTIGKYAFANSGIQVRIASGSMLQEIDDYAFANNSTAAMNLPDSVTEIGEGAFKDSALSVMAISKNSGLRSIGQEAFVGTQITDICLPGALKNVGTGAFRDIVSLARAEIAGGSTALRLSDGAFQGCGIQDITIPARVSYIGEYAFGSCPNLQSIQVDAGNTSYSSLDGVLCDGSGAVLIQYPCGRSGAYEVPAQLRVLTYSSFRNAKKLTEVRFAQGSGIQTIGWQTFSGCTDLKKITVPDTVVSFDFYAFENCTSLTDVILSSGSRLTGVYEGAFYGCSALEEIQLPDSITEIGEYAFYNCASLKNFPLTAAAQVKGIYDYAFYGCAGITRIPAFTQLVDLGAYAFAYTSVNAYTVPATLKEIDTNAFIGCKNLAAIYCEDGNEGYVAIDGALYEKGADSASDYDALVVWPYARILYLGKNKTVITQEDTEILKRAPDIRWEIADSVTTIGENAFRNHVEIRSVTIPANIKTIGRGAFYNCRSLETIRYNATNANDLGANNEVFDYAGTSGDGVMVTIGANVTKIPARLFAYTGYAGGTSNSGIVRVIFEENSKCESIRERAFENCMSLAMVSIPGSITAISDYAFAGCPAILIFEAGQMPGTLGVNWNGMTTVVEDLAQWGISENGYAYYITRDDRAILGRYYGTDTVVQIPDSIQGVPVTALVGTFYNNISLKEVKMPESLETIGTAAFYGCRGMKTITIPEHIKEIGSCAFYECTGVEEVYYNAEALPDFGRGDKVFYSLGTQTDGVDVLIGSEVRRIPSNLFFPYNYITEISTPNICSLRFARDSKCTEIGEGAFSYCRNLRDISLPASIQTVGSEVFGNTAVETAGPAGGGYDLEFMWTDRIPTRAFQAMNQLREVVIPDGVTEIGASAFYRCENLAKITIPASVQSCDAVLNACEKLTTAGPIGSGCDIEFGWTETIPAGAFDSCSGLTEVHIPNGISGISDHAFAFCRKLEEITLPDSVKTIGEYAFVGDGMLRSVKLSDQLESIGESAFEYCEELTVLNVPAGVKEIGRDAMCEASVIVLYGETLPPSVGDNWCGDALVILNAIESGTTENGLQYVVKAGGNAVICGYTGTETSVTIPAAVGQYPVTDLAAAFQNCAELVSVELPEGVTSIGNSTFFGCISLKEISLPDSVQRIGTNAFANCSSLTHVKMPDDLQEISAYAFSNCGALSNVTLPDRLEVIGEYAFEECASLKTIHIPESVKRVGERAIWNCTSLKKVTIPGKPEIDIYVFSGCASLTSAGPIGSGADYEFGWTDEIPDNAFDDCENLSSVILPDHIVRIGESAFASTAISEINIPDSVTEIGPAAFLWCQKLKTLELPKGLTKIHRQTFYWSGVEEITIPDSVKEIAYDAFAGSTLVRINMPQQLETIGERAFERCLRLKSIVIPKNVQTIRGSAFESCRNLDVVYIQSPAIASMITSADAGGMLLENATAVLVSQNNDGVGAYIASNFSYTEKEVSCAGEVYDMYCEYSIHWELEETLQTRIPCQQDGKYVYLCTECDVHKDVIEPAHSLKLVNSKTATCAEDGWTEYICTVCGYTERETVKAGGHTYTTVVTSPTCTEQGYSTHTCTICGVTCVDSYVDAMGHSFSGWNVVAIPDCITAGQERRECGICDHYETREIAATGHSYRSIVMPPTCTEQGYTTHTCTVCGDSYVDGYQAATGHRYGAWNVETAPDCTTAGRERRDCDFCDYCETREIAATGHSYRSVVTPPTCTEQGCTTHTCTVCGDSYVDSYVQAAGHSWGDWAVVKEPTPAAPGLKERSCGVCGEREWEEFRLEITYGDTNGDGRVNTLDLIILRQYLAGWNVSLDTAAADTNGNGTVNTLDLIILRQYLAGWDVTLGPKS